MTPRHSTLLGACMTALLTAGARAQETPCPGGGVTYREHPERGPRVNTGRLLASPGGSEYGVDINSRIEIRIDPDCLVQALEARPDSVAGTAELEARIDSLVSVLQAIPIAIDQVQALFQVYAGLGAAPETGELSGFQSLLAESARNRERILLALEAAARGRIEASGATGTEVDSAVAAIMNAGLADGTSQGYDWSFITSQLEREVEFVRAELAASRSAEQYAIELRAHLLTPDGQYPVPLSGYNEEAACAETRVDPIQLELPAEQAEVYEHAAALELELRKVRGVGNVIVASVSADLNRIRPELDQLLARARTAAAPVETAAKRLLRWGRPGALTGWLERFASLAADPGGLLVTETADTLERTANALNADLEVLRSLASLRGELANANARTAMTAILARASAVRQLASPSSLAALQPDTWSSRGGLVTRFLDRIEALAPALRDKLRGDPNGPVADAVAARAALAAAADSLVGVSGDAIALLGRVLGLPPALAATNLPEPRGLSRRPLQGDLNTDIRLRELCQPRKENDQISVQVRLFRGDQEVSNRRDRFHLRLFGWRSRVAAGLAFSIREHTDTWQPGAAVSWIFTHGSWPDEKNRGLGDPAGLGQIGFGLTAVNLHFDEEESIELGLGPSLSFLNDRAVLGAGWNLQASDDQLYGLISIRLLDMARPTR